MAVGKNAVREMLTRQLVDAGYSVATIIHLRTFVSPSAVVGSKSSVMAITVVGTEARLGLCLGSIVNCGAVVYHNVRVEDFGHLGVNACMAGGSLLGRGAWMQARATLGYGGNRRRDKLGAV